MQPAELLAGYDYAIIDQALVFKADLPWYRNLPLRPIVPYGMEGDAAAMPALLRITPDAPWLDDLARSLPRVISCLMHVQDRNQEDFLFSHLLNHIVVYAHKTERHLLRFYDVRVFPHISRVLKPGQMIALFGPIRRLSFLFQNREIVSHTPPPEVEPGGHIPAFWQIRNEQYDRLMRTESIHELMTWYEWEYKLDTWPNYAAYAEAHAHIERAMEYAIQEYGLRAMNDAQRFSQHTLKYGERFHLHPLILDLMDALPPGDAPGSRKGYAEASSKLTEAEWAHVAARR